MAASDLLTAVSPLPIVDLDTIGVPRDGLLVPTTATCQRKFDASEACRIHYIYIREQAPHCVVQCPFGFATRMVTHGSRRLALTGFIPYPRLGGQRERDLAKIHPEAKIALTSIDRYMAFLNQCESAINETEREAVQQHSMALHEIRKLNRTIKQTAERLCMDASPGRPNAAPPELVRIWKTSEIMSHQFDVIELLANENLTRLPLNSDIEIYRVFDKCVHIFEGQQPGKDIRLRNRSGDYPQIRACDKTFPIIPTVLIQNALKYSLDGFPVSVDIHSDKGQVSAEVSNTVDGAVTLDSTVFDKGVRASTDKDGSGHGLYLAQLVARQHGGRLALTACEAIRGTLNKRVAFRLTLPIIANASHRPV